MLCAFGWPNGINEVSWKLHRTNNFKIKKEHCILLGISPASDCCMPRFRNTLSVPSSQAGYEVLHTSYPAYEGGTDGVFRNVGIQQSDAGEMPKRIHTRFKTRRKFEIKKKKNNLCRAHLPVSLSVTQYQPLNRLSDFREIWYMSSLQKFETTAEIQAQMGG